MKNLYWMLDRKSKMPKENNLIYKAEIISIPPLLRGYASKSNIAIL